MDIFKQKQWQHQINDIHTHTTTSSNNNKKKGNNVLFFTLGVQSRFGFGLQVTLDAGKARGVTFLFPPGGFHFSDSLKKGNILLVHQPKGWWLRNTACHALLYFIMACMY